MGASRDPNANTWPQLATRLARTLTKLTTHELRVQYLRTALARLGPQVAAGVVDQICLGATRGDASARAALIAFSGLLQEWDASGWVESLVPHVEADSPLHKIFELVVKGGQCQSEGQTDSDNDTHVPDYGIGRSLTLGERKALARRPNRHLYDRLLRDPHPAVIQTLLSNPLMTEDDVVRLAAQRPLRADVLREVARHLRWNMRPRVRMAVVLNPSTPPDVGVPLVAVLLRAELRATAEAADTNAAIRAAAIERLARMRHADRL